MGFEQLFRGTGKHPSPGRHVAAFTFIVAVGFLIATSATSAAEVVALQTPLKRFPVAQIFTLLLLMLGPIKIIGPFAKITNGADAALTNRIALRAILFSSLALLLAAFFGKQCLDNFNIPLPVLVLSAGIILLLVALMPLAFPTIVTPYCIAALVVFLALSPDRKSRLTFGTILLAIMLLNLNVMLMTRHILPGPNVLLPILGAVLDVVQVALGLQIIITPLRMMGALQKEHPVHPIRNGIAHGAIT
ncbi:MAG TPA: hypothetical protein DDZ88_21910 [Verrucomicrobiales bacterium]|nr:hypothetical protein [Verrucomicrobiales bacterium]